MDRISKLKRVAAIAAVYYIQQTANKDSNSNSKWKEVGVKRIMNGRTTVQSGGKVISQ